MGSMGTKGLAGCLGLHVLLGQFGCVSAALAVAAVTAALSHGALQCVGVVDKM